MFPQTLTLPAHLPPGFPDGLSASSRVQSGMCTNGKPILREEATGQLMCGCSMAPHLHTLHPHHPHLPHPKPSPSPLSPHPLHGHAHHHHASPHLPHPQLPTSIAAAASSSASGLHHSLPVQVPLPAFTAARGLTGSDPLSMGGISKDPLSTRSIPLGGPYTAAAYATYHPYLYPGYDLGIRKPAVRETTQPLKQWLLEHRKNPYPTKAEKIMLAIITQMTMVQVSTWFANARRRLKKEDGGGQWESFSEEGETNGSQADDSTGNKDGGSSLGDNYEDLSDDYDPDDIREGNNGSPPPPPSMPLPVHNHHSHPHHHHHHPPPLPPQCDFSLTSSTSLPPDLQHGAPPGTQEDGQPPTSSSSSPSSLHKPPRPPRPPILHPTPLFPIFSMASHAPATTTTTSSSSSTSTPAFQPQSLFPPYHMQSLLSSSSSHMSSGNRPTPWTIPESIVTPAVSGDATVGDASAGGGYFSGSLSIRAVDNNSNNAAGVFGTLPPLSPLALPRPTPMPVLPLGIARNAANNNNNKDRSRIWSISSIMGFEDDNAAEQKGGEKADDGTAVSPPENGVPGKDSTVADNGSAGSGGGDGGGSGGNSDGEGSSHVNVNGSSASGGSGGDGAPQPNHTGSAGSSREHSDTERAPSDTGSSHEERRVMNGVDPNMNSSSSSVPSVAGSVSSDVSASATIKQDDSNSAGSGGGGGGGSGGSSDGEGSSHQRDGVKNIFPPKGKTGCEK